MIYIYIYGGITTSNLDLMASNSCWDFARAEPKNNMVATKRELSNSSAMRYNYRLQ